MYSFFRAFSITFMWLCLMSTGPAQAQNSPASPKLGIQLGVSMWQSNCDVPAGGQDTGLQPSFGPNFLLSYGKFSLGGTFYIGNFKVEPKDGIEFDEHNEIQFSDHEARVRGFTSSGNTKRIDFTLNLNYDFSRYAGLSFNFIVNRHEVDVHTYWFPKDNGQGQVTRVPSDAAFLFQYWDTQFWIGQGFHGSVPVETISTRFSIFYNAALLVIAGETGDGKVEAPVPGDGRTFIPTSAQVSYAGAMNPAGIDDRGNRPFGANSGITFNTGAGFRLFKNVDIYGGYNFQFFAEETSEIIDHSRFQGPFFGINWTIQ